MEVQSSVVHIVAGPTASGKSARALSMAQEMDGVIINADSLQIYDALPILTAQPPQGDKDLVPHRLYALMTPEQTCTAMLARELALTEIRATLREGKVPIIVGGTGFYLKALVEGLSPIPEVPEEIRILSEDLLDRLGLEAFYKTLLEQDPETALRLDPHNRQRLVRAWEVLAHTGKGLSYWHSLPRTEPDPDLRFEITLINPLRAELYERCDKRFLMMIENGALEEVAAFDKLILEGTVPFDAAVTHALGFQSLQQHVRGEMDLESAIMLGQNDTRHYAKRQATWFRNQLKARENVILHT